MEYSSDMSGWEDGLTAVHEEATGSDHPIDIASRAVALDSLGTYLHNPSGTILEVGCSSGYLLPLIKERFPRAAVFGADVVKQPLLRLAEQNPDLPLLRFDLTQCPLPDGCVDAVVMLNVLEHIENEQAALSHVYRVLRPGGILVLEVPAGPELYDYYDKYLRHYRRYKQTDLTKVCARAGFEPLSISHLGFWLYPAFWLVKKINRRNAPRDAEEVDRRVKEQITKTGASRLLGLAMSFERFATNRLRLKYPAGIRCTGTFLKRS
jgi:SAM-dependent methyltransferase